ncbi:MAG: YwaF family protein [Clostridia bacterium]|nr:YwaF family protein [Clostridia bacterium]
MYTLVILTLSVIFALGVCYVFKNNAKGIDTLIKILTIAFCALGILRFHLSDSFPEAVFSGSDIFGTLLRWGSHVSYAVLPMSVFFDSRLFKNAALCFSLPVAILCAFNFEHLMEYFLSPLGNGWDTAPFLRYALYITELLLMISVPLLVQRRDSHVFNVKDRGEWQNLALGLPAMLLYMMPAYIPQALFGTTDIKIEAFSTLHLAWIVLTVCEIVILYLFFRRKSKKDKWVLCAFIIIAQLFHSNSVFLRGFRFSRIPLQLCCLAAFFYLIILITKNRRLFDFCYIANMIGALVAVVLASFSGGALQFWNIHYMYEHTMVIVFPVLALSFGLFPRLDRTSLKSMYLIFSCYFLFCLVIGLAINAFSGNPGCEVNYFYMLDYDIAISYIPFATFTGAIKLTLGPVTVYPILVGVVYVVFVSICTLYYLLNRGIYRLIDAYKAKRLPKAEIEKVQV